MYHYITIPENLDIVDNIKWHYVVKNSDILIFSLYGIQL